MNKTDKSREKQELVSLIFRKTLYGPKSRPRYMVDNKERQIGTILYSKACREYVYASKSIGNPLNIDRLLQIESFIKNLNKEFVA